MSEKNTPAMDDKQANRLKKLQESWDTFAAGSFGSFTPGDLRLLLEHFPPIQDLVRHIASAPIQEHIDSEMTKENSNSEETHDHAEWLQKFQAMESAYATLQHTLDATQTELTQAKKSNTALQREAQAAREQLQIKHTENEQRVLESQKREDKILQLERELRKATHDQPQVSFLRQDAYLAQRLDLVDLAADNTLALVQVVAVLAQRDNLERLWQALKERCETESRAATSQETALLEAALAWYNHNWRAKPYQLATVSAGAAYNYEQHLRSRHTVTGEEIHALRLPGITDGSGRIFCKILVETR